MNVATIRSSFTSGAGLAHCAARPAGIYCRPQVVGRPVVRCRAVKEEQKQEVWEPVDGNWFQDLAKEIVDTRELGQRGEAWFAAQVVALLLVAFPPLGLRHFVEAAGWLSVASGLGLAAGGLQNLGKNLTPLPKPRDSSSLITDGIYSYCRHPMYGGLVLASTGFSVGVSDELRLLFALVAFVVLDRKASYEEKLLEKRYGEEYRQYKTTTKKLIPGIY